MKEWIKEEVTKVIEALMNRRVKKTVSQKDGIVIQGYTQYPWMIRVEIINKQRKDLKEV